MRFANRNLFLDQGMNLQFPFFLFIFLNYLYGETHFIFITGGSASGKTTLAKTLSRKLGETKTCYLSLDSYLDKRLQPESYFINGVPNFDHPSMINWPLLLEGIDLLRCGKAIDVPLYDFLSWKPSGYKRMDWKPVVIIEGIHAAQNQLDSIPGLRVFLHIPEDLQYKRRIERDMAERGYSLETSRHFFLTIALPCQKALVDPSRNKAHIVIERLEGQDYLDKAVSYIIKTFEENHKTGYDALKIHLQYNQGKLIEKNREATSHELQ